ncbi:hypothetical protein [Viridibacillus arvi]|uniref:hypothetical protein n=1 Tax=Viridibacillus arvi TaxID=263475 RepID=UPI003D083880
MKKWYFAGIVTSLLLTTSILGACSSNEGADGKSENVSNLNKTGMPIVKEKIAVDGFAAKRFWKKQIRLVL